MSLEKNTQRKWEIISAIAESNSPSLTDISKKTGIPESTLKRQIGQIREEFGMDIRFITQAGSIGRTGYYQIHDWGVLDRKAFMRLRGL